MRNEAMDRDALTGKLTEIIRQKGLKHLPEPVELASGQMSSHFVDGKLALAAWSDLQIAAQAIYATVSDAGHSFDAVGGLSLGADAIAVAVASVADCSWFFVRKVPKARGTRQQIEGAQIGEGNKVLLVDDAVTTGGSIFLAYDIVHATGAEISAASTLVDRGNTATPKFQQLGCPYFPMTTYKTLGIPPVGE